MSACPFVSQRQLDRLTLAGFFFSLLISLSLAAFSFKVSSQQLEAANWVAHTHAVLTKIAQVRATLAELESAVRGFAVSGLQSQADEYQSTASRLAVDTLALRELTADNARQQRRLQELDAAIRQRLVDGRDSMEMRRKAGLEAARSRFAGEFAARQNDRLHIILGELDQEEKELLQQRKLTEASSVKRFWIGLSALIGILIATLASLYLIIGNGGRRHARMVADLHEKDAVLSRFRAGLDNSSDAIYLVDRGSMRFVDVNQTACEMTGYSRGELLQMGPEHIFADQARAEIEDAYDAVIAGKAGASRSEGRHRRKDGSVFSVELSRRHLEIEGATIIVGVARNITSRQKNQQTLRDNQARLETALRDVERSRYEIHTLSELSEVLLSCTSPEEAYAPIGKFCQVLFPDNSGGCYLLHSSRNFLEAVAQWGGAIQSDSLFAPDACWALRRGQAHRSDGLGGMRCRHRHGSAAEETTLCVPMVAMGDAVGVLHLQLAGGADSSRQQELAKMVAERVALAIANLRLRITLRNQSIRDPLTGLFNRRYLEESLHKDLARSKRENRALSVLMVDVDHFKTFNDTRGHDAGDAVLRKLGQMMTGFFRESDSACRYGGEEFTVLLGDADVDEARLKAEQLRQAVCTSAIEWNNTRLDGITISIGIATLGMHGDTPGALIEAADRALYEAKRAGRNRVVVGATQPTVIWL